MDHLLKSLLLYCQAFEIDLTPSQGQRCIDHLELVLAENKKFNLTRITSVEDAVVLHVLDSLLFLPYLDNAMPGPVLDMGTGAGFPGIPLAICSSRPFVLLDSVGKKVNAVQRFAEHLHIDSVCAVHDRVEDFARQHPSQFSCVVARALASLPVLVEYAAPLLPLNGLLVVSKGQPTIEEYDSGLKAATICGMELVSSSSVDLPQDMGHRTFLVYRKSGNPSITLPRQAGAAKRKPLA